MSDYHYLNKFRNHILSKSYIHLSASTYSNNKVDIVVPCPNKTMCRMVCMQRQYNAALNGKYLQRYRSPLEVTLMMDSIIYKCHPQNMTINDPCQYDMLNSILHLYVLLMFHLTNLDL